MVTTRRFDGKRYELVFSPKIKGQWAWELTKRAATKIAGGVRARGKYARVTKEAGGYAVWWRKKKR